MRKILFSDNSLWGLLNFRGGIIRYLLQHDYGVTLVAPAGPLSNQNQIPEGADYVPIEIDRTGTNVLTDLRYYRNLKSIYAQERPDYIFHYTIKPNIYGTLAAHGLHIPTTAMIAGLGHVFSNNTPANLIACRMYQHAMQYPQRVFVLNRDNYELLLSSKIVKREKLLWLQGGEGVDLQHFYPQIWPQNEVPVFLMIGRLLYEKGYAEYVKVAQSLKRRAIFRVMGPLDDQAVPKETLDEHIQLGLIEYVNFTPDVIQEVAKSNCVVLPSYYNEGLSRVLMEACALGRPIICSDIPGCRETVEEGINGFLCKPQNANSLLHCCQTFLELDPSQQRIMGNASRKRAERLFDETNVIEQYMQLIS